MRLIGPLQIAGDTLEARKGRVGERLILATQPLIGGGGPVTERRPALQVLEPMAPEGGLSSNGAGLNGKPAAHPASDDDGGMAWRNDADG